MTRRAVAYAARPVAALVTAAGMRNQSLFLAGTWRLRNTNAAGPPDLSFAYGAASDLPLVWTKP